jgi:hypothetical protein
MGDSLRRVSADVVACEKFPRLRRWCREMARTRVRRFSDQKYWSKPVPGFGDPRARLLVVGLAPAAHGGNRTGRMFTGDRSGDFLFAALDRAGFSNQAGSVSRSDGLRLRDCYVSATARCAPPFRHLGEERLLGHRACLGVPGDLDDDHETHSRSSQALTRLDVRSHVLNRTDFERADLHAGVLRHQLDGVVQVPGLEDQEPVELFLCLDKGAVRGRDLPVSAAQRDGVPSTG